MRAAGGAVAHASRLESAPRRRAAAGAKGMSGMIMQDRLGLRQNRQFGVVERLLVGRAPQVADLQLRVWRQDQPALVDETPQFRAVPRPARRHRQEAGRRPAPWRRVQQRPRPAPRRIAGLAPADAGPSAPSRAGSAWIARKPPPGRSGRAASSASGRRVSARPATGGRAGCRRSRSSRTAMRFSPLQRPPQIRRPAAPPPSSRHKATDANPQTGPGQARIARRNARRHGHPIAPPYCPAPWI